MQSIDFVLTGPENTPFEFDAPLIVIASLLTLLQNPFILLVLVTLWGFPLAASLWHRKTSPPPPAAEGAFLDPSPQALTSQQHNSVHLSQALVVGMVGGLAFCVLDLITEYWWNSAPQAVQSADQAKLAFSGAQVAAAAVVQAIVAAIVTIRVRWLGIIHGLFAAFVAGCVMVVGILGLNLAFGHSHSINPFFAWITFASVLNAGALLSLPLSGGVSAVASWMRRNRLKYQAINGSSE